MLHCIFLLFRKWNLFCTTWIIFVQWELAHLFVFYAGVACPFHLACSLAWVVVAQPTQSLGDWQPITEQQSNRPVNRFTGPDRTNSQMHGTNWMQLNAPRHVDQWRQWWRWCGSNWLLLECFANCTFTGIYSTSLSSLEFSKNGLKTVEENSLLMEECVEVRTGRQSRDHRKSTAPQITTG